MFEVMGGGEGRGINRATRTKESSRPTVGVFTLQVVVISEALGLFNSPHQLPWFLLDHAQGFQLG